VKRVHITPRARRDIREIARYISRDNPAAADRLADRFDEVGDALGANPKLGRIRTDLGRDVRSIPEGRYLLIYREHPDRVDVLRVVHGARDLRRIWRVKD
jgi:toxin ParE1/3/4